ncbi:MAG: twin-arginine translocase TatA/TatE family subunit [Myxococcota bacterium]
MPTYLIGGLGPGELVLVLLILVFVFGASRLPAIGEGLGKAIRGLKRGLNTDDDIDVSQTENQVGPGSPSVRDEVADAEVVEKR